MVRDDLQLAHIEIDDQDVYAIILTFKVFKILMILIIAFYLKTKQFDAINVFFNFDYNENVYCYMSESYKIHDKMLKILKILYDMRLFFVLWLKNLSMKCIELKLQQIFDESCLFINHNDVFLFFYVDDIILIYRIDQQQQIENYMQRLKKTYEMKNLKKLKYFLEVKIMQQKNVICLIQDSYCIKLTRKYEFDVNKKTSATPLDDNQSLSLYESVIDVIKLQMYRKIVESIYYSTIMIKLDVIKIVFKLTEFLINLESKHLNATIQCLQYFYHFKYLNIEYSTTNEKKLITKISKTPIFKKKQIFETIIDAFFANNLDRKNAEDYTFKFFDELID